MGTCQSWESAPGPQMLAQLGPVALHRGGWSQSWDQCSDYELRSWDPRSPACHLCDLGTFLNLSEARFPPLEKEDDNSIYLTRVVGRTREGRLRERPRTVTRAQCTFPATLSIITNVNL